MIFKASKQQLREVAALATNAAKPMGLGLLHYKPERAFTAEDFKDVNGKDGLHLDYVEGRMIKIGFYPVQDRKGYYQQYTDATRFDYESWCNEYPTYTDLLKAAGITEIEV
jgi:hypothetical protein